MFIFTLVMSDSDSLLVLPFLMLGNQLCVCLFIVVASFINMHINTTLIVLYNQCSPGQAMILLDVLQLMLSKVSAT